MITSEEKRDRLARWLKIGAVLGGAIVIAPIIFMAVQGLIGLALALAVGFTINALAPVFALRVATWRIMGLKAIARNNPIETRGKWPWMDLPAANGTGAAPGQAPAQGPSKPAKRP